MLCTVYSSHTCTNYVFRQYSYMMQIYYVLENQNNLLVTQSNLTHFPSHVGMTELKLEWGQFQTILSPQESVHGDITERRLEVEEREGRKRMVTLLQLSSWSPGELPHPTSILSLVELLSKTQRNSPSRHTTIICWSVSLSKCSCMESLLL